MQIEVNYIKIVLFLSVMTVCPIFAQSNGEDLFAKNCSACHLPDQMVVGPSLAEIGKLYAGKSEEFVKWSIAPQKKRPGAIEMPSQAHLGNENLLAIHAYVEKSAAGLIEKKVSKVDPYLGSPHYQKRPQVQRIFMPNASPASIAVALDKKNSLCWDAATCRLRYAWTGGFIDGFPYWKGNGSELAKIKGKVKYVEQSSPFGEKVDTKFLGYLVKNDLPTFRYMVRDRLITEKYLPLDAGKGFVRSFTLSPAPASTLELQFPSQSGVQISSNQGELKGNILTLSPSQAAAFQLTFTFQ